MTHTYGRRIRSGLAVVAAVSLFLGAVSPAVGQNVDWRLHNLDLAGSRYAEIDQITPENAHELEPRWLFQHGVIDGVSNQTTPIVIDGVMYLTDSRGSVYAVDAQNGHHLWTYDVTNLLGGARAEGYIFPSPRAHLRGRRRLQRRRLLHLRTRCEKPGSRSRRSATTARRRSFSTCCGSATPKSRPPSRWATGSPRRRRSTTVSSTSDPRGARVSFRVAMCWRSTRRRVR